MDRFVSNVSGDAHSAEFSARDASGLGSFVPTGRAAVNPFQISSHREGEDAFGAGLDCTGEDGDQGLKNQGQDENM